MHGYPPFSINIPIVFDYVDFLHDFYDPNIENTKILSNYYKHSTKILCVSKTLIESIPTSYRSKAIYLPNGVDLDFYKSYNYENKRKNSTKLTYVILNLLMR